MTEDISSETGLPPGWARTALGNLVTFEYGKALPASRRDCAGHVGVYGSSGLLGCHSASLVAEPALIVGRKGSVGRVHRSNGPCWPIDTTYYVIPPEGIDLGFLHHLLSALGMESLDRSTAIPGLNRDDAYELPILVPPTSEQQRIVSKIEELFTQLDAGVAALQHTKTRLQRYRRAVLNAAMKGEFTKEWREAQEGELEPGAVLLDRILQERRARWEAEQLAKMKAKGKLPKDDTWKATYKEPIPPRGSQSHELPQQWVWATLDQLSYHVTSGSRGWAKYYADAGALFVRVGNFNRLDTAIDLREPVFVSAPSGAEADRTRLQFGDLLITVTADVGMVGIVGERVLQWGEAYINQHVGLVRLAFTDIVSFVAYACASDHVQEQVRSRQYGATKKGLRLEDLRSLQLPLPPLGEQNLVVGELERRLSVAGEMEKAIEQSLKRAERLRQSSLKRAFEGKLVPQDAADEPASVLLERIREQRAKLERDRKPTRAAKGGEMKRSQRRRGLYEVLVGAEIQIRPEELLDRAGFTVATIEEFYEELSDEFARGRIRELRPEGTDVYLEAVSDET